MPPTLPKHKRNKPATEAAGLWAGRKCAPLLVAPDGLKRDLLALERLFLGDLIENVAFDKLASILFAASVSLREGVLPVHKASDGVEAIAEEADVEKASALNAEVRADKVQTSVVAANKNALAGSGSGSHLFVLW